jgi:hypothetical protein
MIGGSNSAWPDPLDSQLSGVSDKTKDRRRWTWLFLRPLVISLPTSQGPGTHASHSQCVTISSRIRGRGGVLKPPPKTPLRAIHPPPQLQEPGGNRKPLLPCTFLASLSNRATLTFCSVSAAVCWAVSPRDDFCPEAGLARTPPRAVCVCVCVCVSQIR